MKWLDTGAIEVEPPKKPLKITGTRFATVLGLNPWSTPFAAWCEITRTYKEPFEDTIFTIAGKAIEPKQIAYMHQSYFMRNLRTPTDVFGDNYFKATHGDFFHSNRIFGGMWDALLSNERYEPEAVLEFKTTKRIEDWLDDAPEYYAIQAALYAYLLKVDDVIMVASFLRDQDYNVPESFAPDIRNTITREFRVSRRYDFDALLARATEWWDAHVATGLSPVPDPRKDAAILKKLKAGVA